MRPFFTTKEIILKCQKTHGIKYDYSLVAYKDSKTKIKIKCNICSNIFEQLPYNHYGGKRGCPKCYNIKSREIQQLSLKDFINKSKSMHSDKYDYSLVKYVNNRFKVKIKCNRCKNIFEQAPMQHFVGNGCPKCWHNSYTSKPEIDFLNFLKVKSRQQNIGNFIVDGIKDNTVYEFLGDFWHGNLDEYKSSNVNKILNKSFEILNKKTLIRFKKLNDMGYKVKYIWESDWKKYKKSENLKPNIIDFDQRMIIV